MAITVATRRSALILPNRIREGLVASYRLGEDSGTRFDSVSPGIGPAAQFTVANLEYLSLADNADISTGDIDFSFACWVYLDTKPSDMAIIAKDTGLAGGREYQLYYLLSSDRFECWVADGTNAVGTATANTLGSPSTATWYFVVFRHSATLNTLDISVNGGAIDSVATTGAPADTTTAFALGGFNTTAQLNGRMQSVGMWKKLLSTAEIASLYNGGSGLAYRDLSGSLLTSLVPWWPLSEPSGTRRDSNGSNHLTDNNTVTQAVGVAGGNSLGAAAAPGSAAGKIGNAVSLNGTTQYLAVPDNSALSFTGSFTIAGWVNFTALNPNSGIVMKWPTAGVREHGLIQGSVDKLGFYVSSDGTTYDGIVSTPAVATGTWYLVVAWHDAENDTLNIQIDNGAVDSLAYSAGGYDGVQPLAIGAYSNGANSHNGLIDAVHIWNRVLTATERTALWNGGNGRDVLAA